MYLASVVFQSELFLGERVVAQELFGGTAFVVDVFLVVAVELFEEGRVICLARSETFLVQVSQQPFGRLKVHVQSHCIVF